MSNKQLPLTEQQRDLGIIITTDLDQVAAANIEKSSQSVVSTVQWVQSNKHVIALNLKYNNREMRLPF